MIGYDKTCKICKECNEDIVHFIIDCKKLEKFRNYDLIDKNLQSSEERIRKLLFRDNRFQEIGKIIKNLWTEREKILETNKKKHQSKLVNFTKVNKDFTQKRERWVSDPGPGRGGCGYLKQRYIQNSLSRG